MRIMFSDAERFIFGSQGFLKNLNPFTRTKRKIIQQYLNIERLKKLRREIQPDLMIVNQISFQGIGKIPQIELLNNNLIQTSKQLNPFVSYKDGENYSICLFGTNVFKTINLTEDTYCLETQLGDISILSINLSKRKKTRRKQLESIELMIERNIQRKYILVGQFNIKRDYELSSLIKSCSLFKLPLESNDSANNSQNKSSQVLYHNDIRVFGARTIENDFSNHHSVVFDIGY